MCWVLLAIWLVPYFCGGIPFSSAQATDGVVKQLADGAEVVAYSGWRLGWPFPFIEITMIDANGCEGPKV